MKVPLELGLALCVAVTVQDCVDVPLMLGEALEDKHSVFVGERD